MLKFFKNIRNSKGQKKLDTQLKIVYGLIGNLPLPMFFKDLDGKYQACNNAFEIFTGKSENEIKNKTVFELWKSEQSIVYHNKDLELIKNGGTQSYEGIVMRADGSLRNVIFKKSVYYNEKGHVIGIIGAYYDITEHINHELLIRQNKDRLEILLDLDRMSNLNDSEIFNYALEKAILLCNAKIGFIGFLNEDETQVKIHSWSKNVMDTCQLADKPILFEVEKTGIWGEVFRKRKPLILNNFSSDNPLKCGTPDGHVEIYNYLSVPVFDENKIVGIVAVGNKSGDFNETDMQELTLMMNGVWSIVKKHNYEKQLISAKEKAEENGKILREQKEEIELNNERLESLLRISQYQTNSIQELLDYALGEAIKLTNSKIGYIYYYNENDKQFILNTWSKDVMKECSITNPQTVYDLDKTGCWGEVVRQKKPIIINNYEDYSPLKKGIPHGHVRLSKFLSIPVIIENKIVAVAGVANKNTDYNSSDVRQLTLLMDNVWKISERITLIDKFKKAKEKAEESDRLKTAFLQNMSHELRTPMNAIMGFSELIARNYNKKQKLEHFSKIISQRCEDLLVIVDDILDLAKIESGQVSVNIEKFNLSSLFAELKIFFAEHKIRTGKQHISFNIESRCNSINNLIETDKGKLKQILINLIGNAFKFTDNGFIKAGCLKDDNGKIVFYVSDTGIGIPEDKRQQIFERFMQVDPAPNRLYGGTGLGLSIVKGLVELLGGKIWLDSEVGKGSTFYFSISYNAAVNIEEEINSIQEPLTVNFNNSKTVLLVEDDVYNASYINEILSETGIKVVTTQFGNEAVEITKNQNIDLVLMDIRLPDISGYEATRQIRRQNSKIKIIAQTAYAAPEDSRKAIDSGCIDYISKPIRTKALISIINKHLKINN